MAIAKVHGLRPVKLTEIPYEERMTAARFAARNLCVDEQETDAVLFAAMFPSDTVYWVRRQADEVRAAA